MKLSDFIESVEPETILLCGRESILNKNSLAEIRIQHQDFLFSVRGKSLAIELSDNILIAKWLILLDGLVSRLAIFPAGIDSEERNHLLRSAHFDLLLTDQNILSDSIEIANINSLPLTEDNVQRTTETLATEWVIATSGTTGSPKLVSHKLESLINTVKNKPDSKSFTWGLLYNLNRFAGIQVFLQCMMGQNKLVVNDAGDDLKATIDIFKEQNVNCLSATPSLWRKMLMLPGIDDLKLQAITLGGEIADSNILRGLASKFPNAKIRHIYASTEAGVGFSISDGLPGFPSTLLNNSDANVSLKLSPSNTLLIKSQSNAKAYLGNSIFDIKDGFIDTGDLISIENDRCYFKGRANGAINVGGNKVQPEFIEQIILNFPSILLASVSAKQSSIMGSLVQATIVVDDSVEDKKELVRNLKSFCKENMDSYMVPAIFKVVDEIKLNTTGKIVRNG